MKITARDIDYVARLSCLVLSEEEKQGFAEDLNVVFKHIEKLNQLDTKDIKPTAHVLHIKNQLREDRVEESMDREFILQNAPEEENGCFKVPRIME